MERFDVLVRNARDQTGNQQYTSTQGVRQREFVRYGNDAQMRIYNKMLMERSSLFMKEGFINVVAREAHYDLPTDIFLKHNVLKVDYSPNGDARLYSPLDFRTPRQEVTAPGYPDCYFLRQGELVLSPIPMQSALAGLRLNYQYTLPTLDTRRGRIERVDAEFGAQEWSYSATSASSYNTSAWGNGIFVAGGTNGTIQSSTDGKTWTARTSGFGTSDIQKIVFSERAGKFIAVGSGGKVSTSSDGITWSLKLDGATSGITTTWVDVVVGGNVIAMVGNEQATSYFTYGASLDDGETFTANMTVALGTATSRSIAYSPTLRRFVAAVGSAGTGAVYYSHDGKTWLNTTTGFATNAPTPQNMVWCEAQALFICGQGLGIVSTSADGITWTSPTTGLSGAGGVYVIYGEGRIVASSGTTIAYSDNGTSWTVATSPSGYGFPNVAAFADGVFFLQNASGNVQIFWSVDGANWRGQASSASTGSSITGNDAGTFIGTTTAPYINYSKPVINYQLVLEDSALLTDETEEDLANGWAEKICVVDDDGVQLAAGVSVTGYSSTTRIISCTSTTGLFDFAGNYVVFGANSTTHSQLPDVAERYLTEYMAFRIQMRDSNSESVDQSSVLRTLEEEIIESIANLEEDLPSVAILDYSMLNYDQDL